MTDRLLKSIRASVDEIMSELTPREREIVERMAPTPEESRQWAKDHVAKLRKQYERMQDDPEARESYELLKAIFGRDSDATDTDDES